MQVQGLFILSSFIVRQLSNTLTFSLNSIVASAVPSGVLNWRGRITRSTDLGLICRHNKFYKYKDQQYLHLQYLGLKLSIGALGRPSLPPIPSLKTNYALEWGGRIPPKPPLLTPGEANSFPRMGGGSPQTPLLALGDGPF